MSHSDPHDDPAPPDLPPPGLPGIRPLDAGDWLRADGPFAARMALREAILADPGADALAALPGAEGAMALALDRVLRFCASHPAWEVARDVRRPDGVRVRIDRGDPARTMARLVQEDVLVMDRGPDGTHRLVGGALCFPAAWTFAEKLGRPLVGIHAPVEGYDGDLARRVQRLFDGLHPDRPLVRSNDLTYPAPDLRQPRTEAHPLNRVREGGWRRRERQTLMGLRARGGPAIFAIRTYVQRR